MCSSVTNEAFKGHTRVAIEMRFHASQWNHINFLTRVAIEMRFRRTHSWRRTRSCHTHVAIEMRFHCDACVYVHIAGEDGFMCPRGPWSSFGQRVLLSGSPVKVHMHMREGERER
jgi:hypothetical protein